MTKNKVNRNETNFLWFVFGGILVGSVVRWWTKNEAKNELTKKEQELIKSKREKQLLEEELKLASELTKERD